MPGVDLADMIDAAANGGKVSSHLAENGPHYPLAGSAQVAPKRASVLVAEADGNRTRQRRGTPLTGFEDQGDHQEPRRLRG